MAGRPDAAPAPRRGWPARPDARGGTRAPRRWGRRATPRGTGPATSPPATSAPATSAPAPTPAGLPGGRAGVAAERVGPAAATPPPPVASLWEQEEDAWGSAEPPPSRGARLGLSDDEGGAEPPAGPSPGGGPGDAGPSPRRHLAWSPAGPPSPRPGGADAPGEDPVAALMADPAFRAWSVARGLGEAGVERLRGREGLLRELRAGDPEAFSRLWHSASCRYPAGGDLAQIGDLSDLPRASRGAVAAGWAADAAPLAAGLGLWLRGGAGLGDCGRGLGGRGSGGLGPLALAAGVAWVWTGAQVWAASAHAATCGGAAAGSVAVERRSQHVASPARVLAAGAVDAVLGVCASLPAVLLLAGAAELSLPPATVGAGALCALALLAGGTPGGLAAGIEAKQAREPVATGVARALGGVAPDPVSPAGTPAR